MPSEGLLKGPCQFHFKFNLFFLMGMSFFYMFCHRIVLFIFQGNQVSWHDGASTVIFIIGSTMLAMSFMTFIVLMSSGIFFSSSTLSAFTSILLFLNSVPGGRDSNTPFMSSRYLQTYKYDYYHHLCCLLKLTKYTYISYLFFLWFD